MNVSEGVAWLAKRLEDEFRLQVIHLGETPPSFLFNARLVSQLPALVALLWFNNGSKHNGDGWMVRVLGLGHAGADLLGQSFE
jgi:hypothetical protein